MNIDIKRRKEKTHIFIRRVLYLLLFFVEYVAMTTLPFSGRMPLFLLSTAICISVFEEPFTAAMTGAAAGLMLDSAEGAIIGLNSCLLIFCCMFTSLLFYFIMRKHIVNVLMLTFAAAFLQTGVRYVFYYFIWGYDPEGKIYTHEMIPIIIFTVISSAVIYPLIKFTVSRLGEIKETFVEEKSEDIVRE